MAKIDRLGWAAGFAFESYGARVGVRTNDPAALVRAGATYYSDEYAVLDRAGRVHPFARPIGLREGATGRQRKISVESLDGVSGAKALHVGLVVLSEYREGARFRPRRLTEGQ